MKTVSAVSALFLAASTVAAQSTVSCVYANWANNGDGKNPCELWVALGSKCDPSFKVEPLGAISNGTSAGYPALTDATKNDCQCNHIAYSLMAACAWCQADVYADSWVAESTWSQACGSGYANSGISTNVNASDLNIPPYATQPIPGPVWDPTDAQAAQVRLGQSGTADGATTSTGAATSGRTIGIVVGLIVAGAWLLIIVALGCCYCMRQRGRKAWYSPMAQHYRAGGSPPWVQSHPPATYTSAFQPPQYAPHAHGPGAPMSH